jgi:hypothetical protein
VGKKKLMIVKILTPWMCKKAIKFHPIITEHRIPSDKIKDERMDGQLRLLLSL